MLSDEAVLALASLVGDLVQDQLLAIQVVGLALAAVASGSTNPIFNSVLVSYGVRRLLLLPLHSFVIATILVLVATRAQPHVNINLVAVVAYTVADVIAGELLHTCRPLGPGLVLLISVALGVYLLNPRGWGCGGECLFRVSKFVLIHEGVRQVVLTGSSIVYHPIVWLSVGVLLIYLTHSLINLDPRQLELTDAVVHAAASSVAASSIGQPARVTTVELMIGVSILYLTLATLPPTPVRDLARSITLYVVILNLRPLGIMAITLLMIVQAGPRRSSPTTI